MVEWVTLRNSWILGRQIKWSYLFIFCGVKSAISNFPRNKSILHPKWKANISHIPKIKKVLSHSWEVFRSRITRQFCSQSCIPHTKKILSQSRKTPSGAPIWKSMIFKHVKWQWIYLLVTLLFVIYLWQCHLSSLTL